MPEGKKGVRKKKEKWGLQEGEEISCGTIERKEEKEVWWFF